MLNQTFDQRSLLRLTKRNEIIKFSLGRNVEEYKESLSKISEEIEADDYQITTHSSFTISQNNKQKTIYSVSSAADYYALKKITDNITRLYKIKHPNRHEISEQILRIFENSSNMQIIRLDISSFFESIKICDILKKIKNDNILSKKSLDIIINITSKLGITGLPRGFPISSPLSELFMEDLDHEIRTLDGVYYYSRYVDDIIIISNGSNLNLNDIIKKIKKIGLNINEKTQVININKEHEGYQSVSYLGYQYALHDTNKTNSLQKRHVIVKMSENKIKKIKTRIVKSLINYNIKDKEYKNKAINKLLNSFRTKRIIQRINFLTGNYELPKTSSYRNDEDESTILKGGIYYNNPLLNDTNHLEELNTFLKKSLFTNKDSLFGRRVRRIPLEIRRELASKSFIDGFEKRITHKFNDSELKKICEIWK